MILLGRQTIVKFSKQLTYFAKYRFYTNSTTNNNEPRYIPEEREFADENENFDWLEKRTNKKVTNSTSIYSTLTKNNNIPKSEINTIIKDKLEISKQFKDYLKDIKEESIKEELEKSKQEIEKNLPVDGANLSITTLIRVCGKLSNQEQRIKEIIKKLLQISSISLSSSSAEEGSRIVKRMDRVRFKKSIVIKLLKEYKLQGKPVMVYELYQLIKDYPNIFSNNSVLAKPAYLVIIDSFTSMGKMEETFNILKEMKERLGSETIDSDIDINRLLVQGYANSNRAQLALELVEKFNRSNPTRNLLSDTQVVNSIIHSFSRQNQIEEMTTFYLQYKDTIKYNHYTLEYLVQGYLKSNQLEKSLTLLSVIDRFNRIPTTTLTFHYIFKYLAKSKTAMSPLNQILEIYNDLMLRPRKLMIESLPIETDFTRVNEYHDKKTKKFKPNINTINVLINCACELNNIDMAYSIYLKEIPRFNLTPNSETFSELEAISFKLSREDLYKTHCGNQFHFIKKSD